MTATPASADLLRRVVPYLRSPHLCNWDSAVAHALADWLERTANDFAALVLTDSPECPNCGEGCAGHPKANWCDRCGNAVESPHYAADPCRCWTEALATARVLAVSFGLTTERTEPRTEQPDAEVIAAWKVLTDRGLVGIEWQGLMPVERVSADLLRIVVSQTPSPAGGCPDGRPNCMVDHS